MDSLESNYCRVCGYKLDFAPWIGNSPSDEICPCCGIQYGYDDLAGGNINERSLIYTEWKKRWIREGMPWLSRCIKKPHNWDPSGQLKNLKSDV